MNLPAGSVLEANKNRSLPNVKNIIPIASGKGGVGKSTVSANIALALVRSGARVGLMDADVYGPSIPTILGISEKPVQANRRILPVIRYGLKVISMGFFVPVNEAVIWRGPMLHKMVSDFLELVDWGELDYLMIDLPPGTGDVPLSLCQTIPLTGAVIVSTPQDVAWHVAQKAIVMFDKLNTPILGVIENMSHFVCSHCGSTEEIFGSGGAKKAAETLEIPYLGGISLDTSIRLTSDAGEPIVHGNPEHLAAKAFIQIAERLVSLVNIRNTQGGCRNVPVKIGPVNQPQIQIEWNDGKKSSFTPKALRMVCPCAACVDELTGAKKTDPLGIADGLRAVAIQPVGRYALHIIFSDGHATGLYGFELLRKLDSSGSS